MVRGDPVCRKEDCSQYDIGLVFKEISSYSDQDKLKFIENVWKPGELFDFPSSVECSNSNRRFVWSWRKRFPWLAYSKYLDGEFCLPCVFFGVQCGRNTDKLDKLYKSLLTLWTSAISRFTKHASGKCEMHNLAVILRALKFKYSWWGMPSKSLSYIGANHSCKILDPTPGCSKRPICVF